METKVILRPLGYNKGDLRLGLYDADFKKYVYGKNVNALFIDFGEGNGLEQIRPFKIYTNKGSLEKKSVVSAWLYRKGYINKTSQLSFLLTIDDNTNTHTYRFIEKV